ncbi:MAG: hypothetical protein EXS16_02220 [Gemmataceae bacterium]|nr:hypothetical protein [Gemmataceae bacterium]
MGWYFQFKPYVPVAQRRANAAKVAEKIAKKDGRALEPIKIDGRAIARTYWGKAWCDNLESYSDYENRLPRGRTYVRNGSVVDLRIKAGQIDALVSGSEVYKIQITIDKLKPGPWKQIKGDCAHSIKSVMQLLTGKLDKDVMERLARRDQGLFPSPKEINMRCSCPDGAYVCKHVAATMYSVGARLDNEPELLFTLRDVDHLELISQAVSSENLDVAFETEGGETLEGQDLGAMFGIEMAPESIGGTTTAAKKTTKKVTKNTVRAKAEPRTPAKKVTVPGRRKTG